jgi:type IV pilus assembly protein PilM
MDNKVIRDNKVLSIEIGDHKTKICIMNYRKKRPRIYKTVILDNPRRSVEDGLIQDKFALAEAIRTKLMGLYSTVTDVVFTISSTRIATHEVIIPAVKQRDIREYVNAGVSDYFPINIADFVISYMVLEKFKEKQEMKYRLLVIAVNNFLLTSYIELAKVLNLNVLSIDYLGNSILQMIKTQISHKETCMYIQMNDKQTMVNIIDNGILRLTRTIGYGSEVYSEALIMNINRVLEYYASKNVERPVQTVYLSCAKKMLSKMGEKLGTEFDLQIKLVDELTGINMKQAMLSQDSRSSDFMNCIGAALAPLGIFPKQYTKKEEQRSSRKVLLEIGVFVAVAALALIIVSFARVGSALTERSRLKASISSMEKIEDIYKENQKLSAKMELLSSIDDSCSRKTELLGELFDEIEAKLPENTVIKSFQADEEGIIMEVSIDTMESAAMTFVQLDTISLINDVKTEQITVETDEFGVTRLNYIITAQYTSSDKEGKTIGANSKAVSG